MIDRLHRRRARPSAAGAIFTADDGRFIAHGGPGRRRARRRGAGRHRVPARMAGPDSGTAYAARRRGPAPALAARPAAGAGLRRRHRPVDRSGAGCPAAGTAAAAVGAAIAGPLLITVGFLVAAC